MKADHVQKGDMGVYLFDKHHKIIDLYTWSDVLKFVLDKYNKKRRN